MSVPILSYSSVADAETYFSSRLFATAWTTASSDSKQQALNVASSMLNRFAWKGIIVDPNQVNSWPRSDLIMEFFPIDPLVVPKSIIEAQYEIAIALLKGYDPERDLRNAMVTSRGYSSVRVAYDPKLIQQYLLWGIPSAAAWYLILPFLDIEPAESMHIHRVS